LSSKLHFDLPSSICSDGGGVPACSRTIYGPREVRDNFHRNLKEDEFKQVVAKIEMIYHSTARWSLTATNWRATTAVAWAF
jgi:hypothetical protein